jgi:glycosyltransferase involved in cell wall biosynthesis
MSTPLFTVLICTHNRVQLLGRVIESLNAARRPEEGVQLLVVANHCGDGTHDLLDAYVSAPGDRLPLRWIAEPTPGKSVALNRALPELNTPVVAFVDDDQRVDAGYLEAIRDAVRHTPDADMFCGRLVPDWDGSEPPWVHDQGRYRIYPLPVPHFDLGPVSRPLSAEIAVPGGGNLFLRTHWLARVGPFATDLGPTGHDLGGSEDSDWVLRALRLGARLHYAPAVLQYHYVDTARLRLGYLMRKAYKRTASTVGLHDRAPIKGGVPAYVYRKLAGYALSALTALGADRRRFYLMRSAAALGEIAGYHRLGRRALGGTPPNLPTPPDRRA